MIPSSAAPFKPGDRVRLVAPGKPAHGYAGVVCLRLGPDGASAVHDDRGRVFVQFDGAEGNILAVPAGQLRRR